MSTAVETARVEQKAGSRRSTFVKGIAERLGREGAVRIRPARKLADIEAVVDLGRRGYESSRYAREPFNREKCIARAAKALSDRNRYLFLLAERNEQPVGILCAALSEGLFGNESSVSVIFIYVAPEARSGMAAIKLIQGVRNWARRGNAGEVQFHVTSGQFDRKTDRFFRRLGFQPTGVNYALRVQRPQLRLDT